ncbi:MAG: hypothetical protein AAFN50_11655 [Pseudomonadota bacterium]
MDSNLAYYILLVGFAIWLQYRQHKLEDKIDRLADELADVRQRFAQPDDHNRDVEN